MRNQDQTPYTPSHPAHAASGGFLLDQLLAWTLPVIVIAIGCHAAGPNPADEAAGPAVTAAVEGLAGAAGGEPDAGFGGLDAARLTALLGREPAATSPDPAGASRARAVKAPSVAGGVSPTRSGAPGTQDTLEGPPSLRLSETGVGTAVVGRRLRGAATHFEGSPGRLYCFTDLENLGAATEVTHVWRHGEREIARHGLKVAKSPRFRTWSYQSMAARRQGMWSCEVLGPQGAHLGITHFEFTALPQR